LQQSCGVVLRAGFSLPAFIFLVYILFNGKRVRGACRHVGHPGGFGQAKAAATFQHYIN
jgi:hypothetical protein